MNSKPLSGFAAGIALLLSSSTLSAQVIYRCVDPRGMTTISNVRAAGNCQIIGGTPEKKTIAMPPPAAAPGVPSPPSFPRVNNDTQRSRDLDRRMILEQELSAEQRHLEQARHDPAARDRAAQHERNIVAIQKELSNAR